jgi:hypothetical protein
MTLRAVLSLLTSLGLAGVTLAACGGSTSGSHASGDDAGMAGDDASSGDDASPGADSGPSGDAMSFETSGTDGTPMRRTCSNVLGAALSMSFGRLDGYLVAIINPGQRGCNGDTTHVHLQVLANNAVYDVAVNVDGEFHQQDIAPLKTAWSEGWHTGVTDSYSAMGVHASMFTQSTVAQLGPVVEQALANANHVTVYATGYSASGVHLVHWKGSNNDGMVVIDPLSPSPHALMFAFAGDNF